MQGGYLAIGQGADRAPLTPSLSRREKGFLRTFSRSPLQGARVRGRGGVALRIERLSYDPMTPWTGEDAVASRFLGILPAR